jgi:PAS domain S-box-containing protein/putative nucleotidyltransferase with HDIG domain
MKDQSLRVLMVEDAEDDALLIIRALKKGGYNPVSERVETAAAMKKALQEKQWDIMLCDYSLPKFNAPSAIAVLKESKIDIPIIIVSGTMGEETAVECMRLGAQDYIMKGNLPRLCLAIARELEDAEVRNKQKKAESQREAALEALRKSEERLRNIAKNMPGIIYQFYAKDSGEYGISYASERLKEYLGITANIEDMFPLFLSHVHEEDKDRFLSSIQKAVETSAIWNFEGRVSFITSGKMIWFQCKATPMRHNDQLVFDGILLDITDRKIAEEALKESEVKYRTILEDIQEGYFEVDFAGNFTFFSDSLCRFLGYSKEELMGMNNRQYTDKEQSKKLFQAFNKVYNTGKPTEGFDWQIIKKDGTKKYVDASIALQKDSSGRPTGFRGIARDIDERKRMERLIEDNEARLRTLVQTIPDLIWLKDIDGVYLACNRMFERFFGAKEADIIGKTDYDFINKDLADFFRENDRKAMAAGKPSSNEEWITFADDGHRALLDTIKTPMFNVEGKLIGVLGIARDITERQKAEEELKKVQLFNTAILDSIPGILYLYDETGHLVQWNKQNEKVTGYSSEELKGMYVLDWFGGLEPDTSNITNSMVDVMKNGYAMTEARIIIKSGNAIPMILTGVQLVIDGKDYLLGIGIDITDRKKAEEALKNSEEKYRNIFENAVEGIYQATLEGRFITVNAAFARMAGYDSPEELIESIKDIGTQLYVHPEDRKRFIEIREAKGFIDGFEVEFYKKDGSKFWVVINSRTVKDEQGKVLYIEGLIEDISIRKHAEEQLHQTLDRLRKAVGTTIQVLVSAVESRDPYTAGHQLQVADLASTIAMEMGFPPEKIEGIRMAGSIHDIGKLSIPAEILVKPTKLTNIEFSIIKEHSKSGYEMLKDVESSWPLAEIVYQHHERMNGSGYPRNLKGDDILIEARIMAVADVVEAMASHRPYRPALGIETALEEIEKNKGILYDNAVADACLKLFREKGYQLT